MQSFRWSMLVVAVVWSAAAWGQDTTQSPTDDETIPPDIIDAPRVTVPQGPAEPQQPQQPVEPQSPVVTSEPPEEPVATPERQTRETVPGVTDDPVQSIGPGELGPGAIGPQ